MEHSYRRGWMSGLILGAVGGLLLGFAVRLMVSRRSPVTTEREANMQEDTGPLVTTVPSRLTRRSVSSSEVDRSAAQHQLSLQLSADAILAEFNAMRAEILAKSNEQDTLFRVILVIAAGTVAIFIGIINTPTSPTPRFDPNTTAIALLDVSSLLMAILAWPIGQRAVMNTWLGAYVETILRPKYIQLINAAGLSSSLSIDSLKLGIFGWQTFFTNWMREIEKPKVFIGILGAGIWQLSYFGPSTVGLLATRYLSGSLGVPFDLAMSIIWWIAAVLVFGGMLALLYHLATESNLYANRNLTGQTSRTQ